MHIDNVERHRQGVFLFLGVFVHFRHMWIGLLELLLYIF